MPPLHVLIHVIIHCTPLLPLSTRYIGFIRYTTCALVGIEAKSTHENKNKIMCQILASYFIKVPLDLVMQGYLLIVLFLFLSPLTFVNTFWA